MARSRSGKNSIGIRQYKGLSAISANIVTGDQRIVATEPDSCSTTADDHVPFIVIVDSIIVRADSRAAIRIQLQTIERIANDPSSRLI